MHHCTQYLAHNHLPVHVSFDCDGQADASAQVPVFLTHGHHKSPCPLSAAPFFGRRNSARLAFRVHKLSGSRFGKIGSDCRSRPSFVRHQASSTRLDSVHIIPSVSSRLFYTQWYLYLRNDPRRMPVTAQVRRGSRTNGTCREHLY